MSECSCTSIKFELKQLHCIYDFFLFQTVGQINDLEDLKVTASQAQVFWFLLPGQAQQHLAKESNTPNGL